MIWRVTVITDIYNIVPFSITFFLDCFCQTVPAADTLRWFRWNVSAKWQAAYCSKNPDFHPERSSEVIVPIMLEKFCGKRSCWKGQEHRFKCICVHVKVLIFKWEGFRGGCLIKCRHYRECQQMRACQIQNVSCLLKHFMDNLARAHTHTYLVYYLNEGITRKTSVLTHLKDQCGDFSGI